MEKKTIRIVVIIGAVVLVIGAIIGTVLGLLLRQRYVELEVWPRTEEYNGNQPLIHVKYRDSDTWNQRVNDFLKEYRQKGSEENPGAENRVACSFSNGPLGAHVCGVPVDEFYPCVHMNQYGAQDGLCLYLKLNKIFEWKPEPYNNTKDLPEMMPEDLKQHIKMVSGKPGANMVWVSCKGENPADIENIGPVQYIPWRGFPAYYYPFTNKEGYLSPLVAVFFEKPRTGVLINIECIAWAKNIIYDHYERRGSVHFGLMVDRN